MSDNETFGRKLIALGDPASMLELEQRGGKSDLFGGVDALLRDVVRRALRGEATIRVERGRKSDSVSLTHLDEVARAFVTDAFTVANQHSKGAWFLPEKVTLKVGLVNLPSFFATQPQFATGLAWEERARAVLADSPAAVLVWSALEPLFEQLFLPLQLRGHAAGTKSREDQLSAWASVDEIVTVLGFDVGAELAVMRYGGGWSRLRAAEQLEAKQHLLAALSTQAGEQTGARYRAFRVHALASRYYSKAKDGQATRKQVLTRPLERTLTAFFEGDWLRFLRYLGESPHPDEEIAAALPETKLFVGGTKSAATVAAEVGVPAEEVERAIATFWEGSGDRPTGTSSPIDARTQALRAFWQSFDEIHTRQAPGMPSLWGLVEDDHSIRIGWEGPEWYNARLYRKLLPPGVLDATDHLWGSTMLPRWPDRIVSEISPHALMAEAFGPALLFWHGCALTAWFVSEGPMSRTNMAGLATYYQDALTELERLGTPIDQAMFVELSNAELRLGPREPVNETKHPATSASGISFELRTSSSYRRAGFERLRDIITRHRHAWAERHLDAYLHARWDSELREAGRQHAQAIAEKGKPPPPKQFARHAEAATNHWFGGDLSSVYAAIGEKSPIRPERVALMPIDRREFATRVFARLGGTAFERQVLVSGREEAREQAEKQDQHAKLGWLAGQSLRLVQLEEALRRPPEMSEFGTSGFTLRSSAILPDREQAWARYVALVETARSQPAAAGQTRSSTGSGLPPTPAAPTHADDGSQGIPEMAAPPERRSRLRRLLGL